MKFTIEYINDRRVWQLTIHHTGEIREADDIDTLFKSLLSDFGYYLRRK